MNNAGEFQIEKYIRNYGLVSVLDKVDDASFSKIKFKDDKITEESAVEFIKAIGAFLRVEQGGDLNKQIYYTEESARTISASTAKRSVSAACLIMSEPWSRTIRKRN